MKNTEIILRALPVRATPFRGGPLLFFVKKSLECKHSREEGFDLSRVRGA